MSEPTVTAPLNPRVFMILLAFAEGSAHGYQIMKTVEERSHGDITLDAGSLYRTLAKLLDEELISETEAPQDLDRADARRRYYRLTEMGRRVVAAEARRLAGLVEFARAADLLARPETAR